MIMKTIYYFFLTGCLAEAVPIVWSSTNERFIWHVSLLIIFLVASIFLRNALISSTVRKEDVGLLFILKGISFVAFLEHWTISLASIGIFWSVVMGSIGYFQYEAWLTSWPKNTNQTIPSDIAPKKGSGLVV